MALGIHFMANWVQGGILTFCVSGTEQSGLLIPVYNAEPESFTGGAFGLEANLRGLICVVGIFAWLYLWQPQVEP